MNIDFSSLESLQGFQRSSAWYQLVQANRQDFIQLFWTRIENILHAWQQAAEKLEEPELKKFIASLKLPRERTAMGYKSFVGFVQASIQENRWGRSQCAQSGYSIIQSSYAMLMELEQGNSVGGLDPSPFYGMISRLGISFSNMEKEIYG